MKNSRNRVPTQTSDGVQQGIQGDIDRRVRHYDQHRKKIPERLRELEREWDIERAIEANASTLAFAGLALSLATKDRRWLALPIVVTGFLFQHAIQGWCPPVPILRRLGFRTAYEIEQERTALKALRGDFDTLARRRGRTQAVLNAARA